VIIYDFDPNNLPAEYLAAIGLVVASASQTDHVMREFIGSYLGVDMAESLALGAHISTRMKDDIIRALVELNAECASDVDELDDILDRVREATEHRNAVAHNAFARHPETGQVFSLRERARGSLQVDLRPIEVAELTEIATELYGSGLALVEYMMARGIEPRDRERPLHEPLNRGKKARQARRDQHGPVY
jgi:hypothetical protein